MSSDGNDVITIISPGNKTMAGLGILGAADKFDRQDDKEVGGAV